MPYFFGCLARAAIRDIEQPQAQEILVALTQYVRSGQGDVVAMRGETTGRLHLSCAVDRTCVEFPTGDQSDHSPWRALLRVGGAMIDYKC